MRLANARDRDGSGAGRCEDERCGQAPGIEILGRRAECDQRRHGRCVGAGFGDRRHESGDAAGAGAIADRRFGPEVIVMAVAAEGLKKAKGAQRQQDEKQCPYDAIAIHWRECTGEWPAVKRCPGVRGLTAVDGPPRQSGVEPPQSIFHAPETQPQDQGIPDGAGLYVGSGQLTMPR